ncbi:nuclear transport factor 2 family protein [Sphingobium subterraneum]|uniref:Ketosteroid isomerase-like protein n=1 Tax=Sphingobium subterraneum TaxID=627688 RepID=A0A841J3B2_9SPHN|nr:nuclear transport factor 2 family protein [Sphingobium subterraneum]MBB6124006.1 ketosteroid isomerase-like protein [Sphingobium subterraneum]
MAVCPWEDRVALEDLLVAFAHAVDSLHDLDGIGTIFTDAAVFDLSGVGFPSLTGRAAIRQFYANTFDVMAAHAHYLSNFAVTSYAGDKASVRTYVVGMGRYKAGGGITMRGRYYFDVVRTPAGWKAALFSMDMLIPPEVESGGGA